MAKVVGITGQPGFIGTHITRWLGTREGYTVKPFEDAFFENPDVLAGYVRGCDVVIHLAAVNRHEDMQELYRINVELTGKLIAALGASGARPHVIYSSSSQEERDNLYGSSKKECRRLLQEWCAQHDCPFTGMVIPNVFGPFGRPFYNSFVATFCHLLATGEGEPEIQVDAEIDFIYVVELAQRVERIIAQGLTGSPFVIEPGATATVSQTLATLRRFRDDYVRQGVIPALGGTFERDLFNTFRSYIPAAHFPVHYTRHSDDRGDFVELVRTNPGGQFSFSTTMPGITRGNHYHIRKIERFSVIRGKARIQLRRVGTEEVTDYVLSGEEPGYVDMPVYTTHNLTNIGTEPLYTAFWINEFFDAEDPDTYYEEV